MSDKTWPVFDAEGEPVSDAERERVLALLSDRARRYIETDFSQRPRVPIGADSKRHVTWDGSTVIETYDSEVTSATGLLLPTATVFLPLDVEEMARLYFGLVELDADVVAAFNAAVDDGSPLYPGGEPSLQRSYEPNQELPIVDDLRRRGVIR
ncbi:MAG: hypothetical protein O7G84_00865 [Gammaproteobacteria bacterium]|nr:hypothetical protein [Gammaproteobacteria bacterium]